MPRRIRARLLWAILVALAAALFLGLLWVGLVLFLTMLPGAL